MNKQILLPLLIIIVLVGGYFLFFSESTNHDGDNLNNNPEFNLDNNVDVQIRDMSNVPAEYYSGGSRYSYGQCEKDGDCGVTGCSLEMCTSNPNMVTTCELLGEVPDKEKYECGCIKDVCGWFPQ